MVYLTHFSEFKDVVKSTAIVFPFAVLPIAPVLFLFGPWYAANASNTTHEFIQSVWMVNLLSLCLYVIALLVAAMYSFTIQRVFELTGKGQAFLIVAFLTIGAYWFSRMFFIALMLSVVIDFFVRDKVDTMTSTKWKWVALGLPLLYVVVLTFYAYTQVMG